jgi:hypothetical protein
VVQTVNIWNHVPILVDITDSNYNQWRCFFDAVLGKFGLDAHVTVPPPMAARDAEWRQVDCCIVNGLYTTVTKGVFDIIHKPRASAFTIWTDIEGLFRDNELQRAVYLEAEFRGFIQGDLSITEYCSRLKKLADNLRDVGHPVSETSQVLNLLRVLNQKFRHVKPVIKSKSPPHTFMSARSYLLLEELQLQHDDKMESGTAYVVSHGGASSQGGSSGSGGPASSGGQSGSSAPSTGSGASRSKPKNKRRGSSGGSLGGGGQAAGGGAGGQHPPFPAAALWAAGYNPWRALSKLGRCPFAHQARVFLGLVRPFRSSGP